MPESIVVFPNDYRLEEILAFCTQADNCEANNKVAVDFATLGRIEPFTILYVTEQLRCFKLNHPGIQIRCLNARNKDYAARMGFLDEFCEIYSAQDEDQIDSDNKIPLTSVLIEEVKKEARENWEYEQDVIERKSDQISKMLTNSDSGNLYDTMTYSIRELMRNIVEHSESDEILYCAQSWANRGTVELAILDHGIGLLNSINENPYIDVSTDSDAIQQVLMPGVSSKYYKGARFDRDNPWQNSGYGLYMLTRLCRLGGELFICSGHSGILIRQDNKLHVDLGHYFQGTAIKIVLKFDQLDTLSAMLEGFKNEGIEIAREIRGTGIFPASKASLMLSRDFKLGQNKHP